MKVLDRAFIKAYGMGDAEPPSLTASPAQAQPPSIITAKSSPLELPLPAATDTVDASVLSLDNDLSAAITRTRDVDIGLDLTSKAAVMRSDSPPAVRPLLQVDRFAWPDICAALVAAENSFQSMTEELLAAIADRPRLFAITSRHRGEGRTTFLLTIAQLLAKRDCRVAIVDGDFQNPQLARQLGILPEAGWEDVLSGRLPLAEVLIESNEDQVALLPLRAAVHKSETLTRGPRTSSSLETLRHSYQLVLCDVGTLSERARDLAPLLATGSFDASILVRDIRMTSTKELSDAARRLTDAGIHNYGIAENFVTPC